MQILVESKVNGDGDHLFWEETNSDEYVENNVCDGCGAEMTPLSMVKNTQGEIGLVSGLCRNCGYIKKIRNLSTDAMNDHFSGKWLVRREEEVLKNTYVYDKLKPFIVDTGRVLDVGCGLGGSLLTFYEKGYEVYGVEPSNHRSHKAKEVLPNIETGLGEAYLESTPHKFDVIYFFDVLQYVDNPFRVLEMAINLLTEDGKIFIKMGAFAHKSNYSQFSHLGVNRNFMNLYSLKALLRRRNIYPVYYTQEPCEMILSKKKMNNSSEILKSAVKVDENAALRYAKKSLKFSRLRILGKVTVTYNGRRTVLKLKKPIKDVLPIVFEHDSKKIPLLLK